MTRRFAALPGQAYLLECLDYDPETGIFTWRVRPRHHFQSDRICNSWNAKNSGKATGCAQRRAGVIKVDGKLLHAHRIAWKMITGADPTDMIDHKNRQDTDNRWDNLRAATPTQNQHNRGTNRNSSTGLKGARFDRTYQKFAASIQVNKRQIFLGYYATKEEAHEVYCEAARLYYGEFWCAG